IPSYQTALAVTDLLTAGLLLAQFSITRARALLVLGCGYLFTGCMVVPHTLSYPGLFSELGLLPGSGTHTTAWLSLFCHGGFPTPVMAYGWLKGRDGTEQQAQGSSRAAILAGIAVVLVAAVGLVLLATYGKALLPPLVDKGAYTVEMHYVSVAF